MLLCVAKESQRSCDIEFKAVPSGISVEMLPEFSVSWLLFLPTLLLCACLSYLASVEDWTLGLSPLHTPPSLGGDHVVGMDLDGSQPR